MSNESFDQQLKRNIGMIKGAVRDLGCMGLKVEIDKDVENMFGVLIDNVYIVDRMGEKIVLQKHLFTITARRTKK